MSTAVLRCVCAFVMLMLVSTTTRAQQVPVSPAPQGNLQGFSVVLVLGDLQGGASPDNIPAAARAALGDLKDFLPYKSYRVLDSSWILGSTTQLFRGTSRLRGAEEQVYEVSFQTMPSDPAATSLQVRFKMNEAGNPSSAGVAEFEHRQAQIKADMARLSAARAALEKDLQTPYTGSSEERKAYFAAGQARLRDMQTQINALHNELTGVGPSAGQTLIDTSFNMRIGETVVVGTSRVRGDKALIALLTAVRM